MSSRFHINSKGEAGKCAASPGACPFGTPDEHYETAEAARAGYETLQEAKLAAGPPRSSKALKRRYPEAYTMVCNSAEEAYGLNAETRVGDTILTKSGRLYRVRISNDWNQEFSLEELNITNGVPIEIAHELKYFQDDFEGAITVGDYAQTDKIAKERLDVRLAHIKKRHAEAKDQSEEAIKKMAILARDMPQAFEEVEKVRKPTRKEREVYEAEESYRYKIRLDYERYARIAERPNEPVWSNAYAEVERERAEIDKAAERNLPRLPSKKHFKAMNARSPLGSTQATKSTS